MDVEPFGLPGPLVLSGEQHDDHRGWLRKLAEFSGLPDGLETGVQQVVTAANHTSGTVRGLHYQVGPELEAKFIWCLTGSLLDVLVDLRPEAPSYGRWASAELHGGAPRGIYVPPGFAHGYQTTSPDTVVLYLITAPYRPEGARTLRWDDHQLGISWPLPVSHLSEKDAQAPTWPPAS